MFTAYICRHGKSELNQQKRLQGVIDSPLTAKGINNAHAVAVKLIGVMFDAGIYSSDLGRASATAEIVAQDLNCAYPIVLAEELREVSFGDLAGMPIAEAEAKYPDLQRTTSFTPPGGEALSTMQQRVVCFVRNLAVEHSNQTALLVTHDCVINALYAAFAGIDLGPYNAEHYNAHDFVGKFTIERGDVTAFEEYGK